MFYINALCQVIMADESRQLTHRLNITDPAERDLLDSKLFGQQLNTRTKQTTGAEYYEFEFAGKQVIVDDDRIGSNIDVAKWAMWTDIVVQKSIDLTVVNQDRPCIIIVTASTYLALYRLKCQKLAEVAGLDFNTVYPELADYQLAEDALDAMALGKSYLVNESAPDADLDFLTMDFAIYAIVKGSTAPRVVSLITEWKNKVAQTILRIIVQKRGKFDPDAPELPVDLPTDVNELYSVIQKVITKPYQKKKADLLMQNFINVTDVRQSVLNVAYGMDILSTKLSMSPIPNRVMIYDLLERGKNGAEPSQQ